MRRGTDAGASRLLPLQLGEARGDIAGMVLVEPDPSVALLASHPPNRGLDAAAGRDLAPHVAQQHIQVPLCASRASGQAADAGPWPDSTTRGAAR